MASTSYQQPSRDILAEAHRRRLQTLALNSDRSWLEEITPQAANVLSRMSRTGLLHRAGHGRYVVAKPGTTSLTQNASPELIVDLLLRPRPYYLGWLTALIDHRLTDLHSRELIAGIPQGERVRGRFPIDLKLVYVSPSRWPSSDELVRVRAASGTKEFVWRSGLERTLVDAVNRPDLSGGFETVALAWARALGRSEVSWPKVAASARRSGDAAARRTAFMLVELGLEQVAEAHLLADLDPRQTSTPLDRTDSYALPPEEQRRDPRTGVVVNVPRDHLRAWLAGEVG